MHSYVEPPPPGTRIRGSVTQPYTLGGVAWAALELPRKVMAPLVILKSPWKAQMQGDDHI
jgi:hypothetical protein